MPYNYNELREIVKMELVSLQEKESKASSEKSSVPNTSLQIEFYNNLLRLLSNEDLVKNPHGPGMVPYAATVARVFSDLLDGKRVPQHILGIICSGTLAGSAACGNFLTLNALNICGGSLTIQEVSEVLTTGNYDPEKRQLGTQRSMFEDLISRKLETDCIVINAGKTIFNSNKEFLDALEGDGIYLLRDEELTDDSGHAFLVIMENGVAYQIDINGTFKISQSQQLDDEVRDRISCDKAQHSLLQGIKIGTLQDYPQARVLYAECQSKYEAVSQRIRQEQLSRQRWTQLAEDSVTSPQVSTVDTQDQVGAADDQALELDLEEAMDSLLGDMKSPPPVQTMGLISPRRPTEESSWAQALCECLANCFKAKSSTPDPAEQDVPYTKLGGK